MPDHHTPEDTGVYMLPVNQQTILITGSTDGLGRALACELAEQGATLILHGRSEGKGKSLLQELRKVTDESKVTYLLTDFSRLSDVRRLADEAAGFGRLDALVNNAGIGIFHRDDSQDGYELTFQANYLAGYVLAARLAPMLARSTPARIVNVSSYGQAPIDFDDPMMHQGFDGIRAYAQSKLAQIMHAIDLAEALGDQGVTANAVHPAPYMPTNMVRGRFTPQATIEQGMQNTLRVITDLTLEKVSGRFFNQREDFRAAPQAYDPQARARLRTLSEELTGIPFPGTIAK